MTESTTTYQTFLGFDVGKDTIAVHDASTGRSHILANKAADLRRFLKTHGAEAYGAEAYAVCEATGGYENTLLDCLLAANITAHRGDARKIKAYIRSFGTLAKTDAIDAEALANYGRERHDKLAVWRALPKRQVELAALAHRREDLVDMRTAEKNRAQAPGVKVVAASCRKMITYLDKQIEAVEQEINNRIAGDDEISQTVQVARAMKGIGPVVSTSICAFMPELGTLTRRQAAALAGLAPHPRDSGKSNGYRKTQGGRSQIRRLLYMAAMSARCHDEKMREFYERLIANGKKPMVALTAVMRKMIVILNAKVRDARLQQQS